MDSNRMIDVVTAALKIDVLEETTVLNGTQRL